MMSASDPVLRDLVLVGGGHSHVGVLRRWHMAPVPGVRLTLICSDTDTPYSGMLPGHVAGHYTHDEVHLDLRRLCAQAGARYLNDQVIGIDRASRQVLCRQYPPLPYDVLSINTGSTPGLPPDSDHSGVTPVKPVSGFSQRWNRLLSQARSASGPLRIAVVGAGAGGVELILAMQYRLQRETTQTAVAHRFDLFGADHQILPTHAPRVRARLRQALDAAGIHLHLGQAVQPLRTGWLSVTPSTAGSTTSPIGPFDAVIWTTQAQGPAWLADSGLACDAQGFVRVDDCLRSLSDPQIFAAGDVAAMVNHPLEKAGVFAVRMGMPLAHNLCRQLRGEPLQPYRPQRRWLALIGTGPRHAVASRGWWSASGGWVWSWKEWIDRRFMARFGSLGPMLASRPVLATTRQAVTLSDDEQRQRLAATAMRCGGCGAKVGNSILSRVLKDLVSLPSTGVLVGLDRPDDAAVLQIPPGQLLVQSVDFFRAFIDDPYRFGRIAAHHALGDVYAMGAQPHSASALATIPPGLESQVELTLRLLMSGALEVLNEAHCQLVGGHTGEGQELALGFAVNGLLPADANGGASGAWSKGGLQHGQALILTKPLGTGVLMAAHARGQARGRWIDQALQHMDQSHRDAIPVLRQHGVTACTDVTGFGLLGHLNEMLVASGTGAVLDLEAIPCLDGAQALAATGVHSSLQPANLRARHRLVADPSALSHPAYPLLFDPQTAGGLLASVPWSQADTVVQALRAAGWPQASCVGQVTHPQDPLQPIRLRTASDTDPRHV